MLVRKGMFGCVIGVIITTLLLGCRQSINVDDEDVRDFNMMDYFDRDLIIGDAISEIKIIISKKDIDPSSDDLYSCIIYAATFDERGNEIRFNLNRLGSYNYTDYDHNGGVIDWGFENKSTGVKDSIAEMVKEDPQEYARTIAAIKRDNEIALGSKIDFRKKLKRGFYDPCYSIDGSYELVHEDFGNLPKKAVAYLIHSNLDGEIRRPSPERLYIYYSYVFRKSK